MIPKTVQHTDSTKWKEEKIDFSEMITYFIFASSLKKDSTAQFNIYSIEILGITVTYITDIWQPYQWYVFCCQNYSDLLWEKNVLVIEKNFWNPRLKAENLQQFWDH